MGEGCGKPLALEADRWCRRAVRWLAILASCGVLVGCNSGAPEGTSEGDTLVGETVTILGTLTGNGEDKLMAAIAPFTEATGIEVVYEGTDAFTTLIAVRVDAGNAPDIALFPQPGLMLEFAQRGDLIPQAREPLTSAYAPYWLDLASVDGDVYGVWMRADVKSLVWYNPQAFAAAGYDIPTTWDELTALSQQIIADGNTPWCLGMESGAATGWVGTDWVEEILLRQAGPSVYDEWVSHDIPFNAPAVEAALETFGEIVRDETQVRGGPTGAISIPFGDAPAPLFSEPPGCYLHRQASFISDFLPSGLIPEETVDVFALPGMTSEPPPVLVGGIVYAQFNDSPAATALMAHLASVEAHTHWANEGYISPHNEVSLDAYPDALTRNQAAILQDASVIRFDGSDLMPGAIGTGTFWTGMVDYVGGADAAAVLADIEASWPEPE
ncbi:ABC transporter substrate-binding protein [Leptolyngbya iicbica]|uniref:Carbohydrate ABC transporter substrate-binding protein n=2 Tax=Cyanophyceae TaxID=3028117 RepID=A0A4Q7E4S7_9CYAN|nr:ABC transporter substrate-binding protein [Leptolyngbya sp. LK]RZM77293.1 carbohydrate ABC transporter substrate-binding protein [Leptolyngbya sp. LK]